MISNFSEVEKSLKRCLKEKVSITAATVVGFLIAGTVAFGGTPTAVTVTGDDETAGKITIAGVNSAESDKIITNRTTGKITIDELKTEAAEGSLEGLLTVKVEGTVATITGVYNGESEPNLGTLTITSGTKQGVTFLSTDTDVTSIKSDLKVGVTGKDGKPATAMEATNAGDTVTNTGTITAKAYGVGMKANAGATAVNAGTITVANADGVGMLASGKDAKATNKGTFTVTAGTGMSAENGGTIENTDSKTIAISSAAGTGMVVTGNGTATNAGEITVGVADSVGMSATTAKADETATLINNGKINVTLGTGISVAGDGTAEVTFGKTGTIEVAARQKGIEVVGAGTTNVTGGTITLTGAAVGIDGDNVTGELKVDGTEISVATGTGIKAKGNVELKDIAITLTGAGTGIVYDASGAAAKTVASISTKNMEVEIDGATGITATMSGVADSTLDITTGTISTGHAQATGITVTGTALSQLNNGETPTTATVTTTLGNTLGTGVKVEGKANNDITVNLGAADVVATAAAETKAVVSGTGVEIVSNADTTGKVNVNINQKDLKVNGTKELVKVTANAGDITIDAKQAVELETTANLVNVTTNSGKLNVNLNADGQIITNGSLVNIAAATAGTIDVDVNKNVEFAETATGSIVTATMEYGALNVNLNVKDINDSTKTLKVAEGKTALNLVGVTSNGKASVKNTGNVTIAGKGTLVNGNAKTTLTNQGLITVSDVKVEEEEATNNSHISKGEGVAVKNYGIIKLAMTSEDFIAKAGSTATEKTLDQLTTEEVTTALKALGVISEGDFSSVGNIQLKDGVFTAAKAIAGENSIDGLNTALKTQKENERAFAVAEGGTATINATPENNTLEKVQLTLNGTMTVSGEEEVIVDNSADINQQIVIGKAGQLTIDDGATLNYSGNILASEDGTEPAIEVSGTLVLADGALTMGKTNESGISPASLALNRVGIKLANVTNATVDLNNFTVNSDIAGTLSGTRELQGTINFKGISAVNNKVTDVKDIVVKDGMLTFGADSAIVSNATGTTKNTTIDLDGGKMGVKIGENGNNVLKNSTLYDPTKEINFTNQVGKVVLLTGDLTENTEFDLGNHADLQYGDIVANEDIYYKVTKGEGNNWNATFNKDALLETTGTKYAELNNMYIATQSIHDLLSVDIDERAAELDNLYSNNIYSETVKMSLDTLKMNEDAVLSLNVRPKQGEFTAQGKFLFNNTDYDREGVLKDYKVETKNTGLLGALEYGLTDTSSVGFAFAGTKQDLDMKNGASADGDAFYFGLYRNDKFNNIDLTTGLGYMTDRVDAKSFVGKDKFDSTAFSGYIQGKYNYAIAENLTLSPKARLTVTRFQQDSINTGRMKQEEIKDTMADVELGVELKKGIALETGKMNLLAGASFTTNIAGKDDDFYRVDFLSNTGKANSTKVKGANLEKNSLKLNLGADVELTNGVFYNGGLSYEFDDEDRDSIGVTLGAGYKF